MSVEELSETLVQIKVCKHFLPLLKLLLTDITDCF